MPDSLKFGLFSMNSGPCADPATMARIARTAEAAGFDSLWAGEHVVLPDPRVPPSPMNPEDPILDPVVALTYMAAQTSTIRLGTGIIILPQRNPLVLAKELASLDVLSGGRLLFGVGVGYLEPEFRALGIPFADRGARTLDYIRAMQAIWGDGTRGYDGRFVSFGDVQSQPQPAQRPHPPIVMGGHSPQAYRRAVELAQGWYGFGLNLERTTEALAGLREASEHYSRPPELGPLEVSVTPRGAMDPAAAERFAAFGVHRLILMPRGNLDAPAVEQFVTSIGETLIGRV